MKQVLKSALRRVAPAYYDRLITARVNRHGQNVLHRLGVPQIQEKIVARLGADVVAGPFAGMHYLEQSTGSSYLPKLIGSYEEELFPAWQRIFATHYDVVVDVGCAEGYYAVGLALKLAQARVLAFDIDARACELCRELARRNGVEERVEVRGACDPATLESALTGCALVLCDCEGYELDLLDPVAAPRLRICEILVELHDLVRPGITPALMERFRSTHELTLIDSVERNAGAYPHLHFLPLEQRQIALSEFRNGVQQWGHFVPRAVS